MKKRAFLNYLLIFFFLIGAFISTATFFGFFQNWNWVNNFLPASSLWYQVFHSLFLALAWLLGALLLWLNTAWSIVFCKWIAIISIVWFWMDRVFLSQNPLPFVQQLLPLIISIILLAALLFFLEIFAVSVTNKSILTEPETEKHLSKGDEND